MTVKGSLRNAEDLDRMLRGLFQTMAQGNAEMAAGQEQALEVASSYTRLQMQHLNNLTGETGATISELRASVVSSSFIDLFHSDICQHQLFPVIVSISRRQDALDQVGTLCLWKKYILTTHAEIRSALCCHEQHDYPTSKPYRVS